MSTLILGGIIGLLIGLAWCYWQQIQAAYQNRNALSAGSRLLTDVTDLKNALKA